MLKQRVITGLVLAPLVIAAIYLLPVWGFAIFVVLAAGFAAYEWAGLAGIDHLLGKFAYVLGFAALALLGWEWALALYYVFAAVAVWAVATLAVLLHPKLNVLFRQPWAVGLLGWVVLLGAWAGLVILDSNGAHNVLFALFICWGADIGAYFAGKAYGRRKLAPSISPGKTWEGVMGGYLAALMVCTAWWSFAFGFQWQVLVLITLLVPISVIGDLFESVLKRQSDVKDSGSLLPGHGGVLDRVDSILAVAPVMAFIILLAS